jgi:hypothetical protein
MERNEITNPIRRTNIANPAPRITPAVTPEIDETEVRSASPTARMALARNKGVRTDDPAMRAHVRMREFI